MKATTSRRSVDIVEVGPRDGFQSVATWIPTDTKLAVINGLHEAGVRRIESTSFVSPTAVPQLSDAAAIVNGAAGLPGLDCQILVPTEKQARRALDAGARHLAFVLSVSDRHNRDNVRRSTIESVAEYARICALAPADTTLRLNLATAFDCPHEGRVSEDAVLAVLRDVAAIQPDAEIALCDTTGRAVPSQVAALFGTAFERFPAVQRWAFHAHDTYGMGAANVISAWNAGVGTFDAAIAGLGGCPFAPGATGNIATEDLVWMFEEMGVATGVDLSRLIVLAEQVASLPSAQIGGRVRDAWRARRCTGIAA